MGYSKECTVWLKFLVYGIQASFFIFTLASHTGLAIMQRWFISKNY